MSAYTSDRLFLTDSHLLPATMPAVARELLDSALQGLAEAQCADDDDLAFALAHRSALRVAAAVIAAADMMRPSPSHPQQVQAPAIAGSMPGGRRLARSRRAGRPQSAWVLLAKCSPPLREWADFFAANAVMRAAAEAGTAHVTPRMAHDMVREVLAFMRDAISYITADPPAVHASVARAG